MKNWLLITIVLVSIFVGWMSNDWYHMKFGERPTRDTIVSWVDMPTDTQRVNFLLQARLRLERKLALAQFSLDDRNKKIDSLTTILLNIQKDTLGLEPVAILDTVIGQYKDTLKLRYYLLDNYFDYTFYPGFRKPQIKEITKYVDKFVEVNPKLWIQFASMFGTERFGGRVGLGYKNFGVGYMVSYKEKPLIELIFHKNF